MTGITCAHADLQIALPDSRPGHNPWDAYPTAEQTADYRTAKMLSENVSLP